MQIKSFPYFIDSNTEIIILGTMPGAISLEKQEYYANPRNHFWKIIYSIFDDLPISDSFEEKKEVLLSNKIGIWDVLENCERKGSLDIHIKNHKENDFENLFKELPKITKIIFNGKKSYDFFFKRYGKIEGITYFVMPSTSPANTMTFENKLKIWSSCFI
ncbi:DNA-deoxyinosine glycosylase [Flavobacterium sp. 5]|uniref:DNA-deoxyinosine glycosylase n=1 Tax=Flavobacterium sp. 5 TaxID=2035199 RepID=UPI000C2C998B|nr:DNA-deoxyinosine glycosylase [Flavobacterium sp. 5]PKB18856.1 G/U mismatch-specific uracil-DNA glycosylase [Flavobacterium sp. 5]